MELVLAGKHSKNIAFDLGISQRTVKTHRARIKGSRAIRATSRAPTARATGLGGRGR